MFGDVMAWIFAGLGVVAAFASIVYMEWRSWKEPARDALMDAHDNLWSGSASAMTGNHDANQ